MELPRGCCCCCRPPPIAIFLCSCVVRLAVIASKSDAFIANQNTSSLWLTKKNLAQSLARGSAPARAKLRTVKAPGRTPTATCTLDPWSMASVKVRASKLQGHPSISAASPIRLQVYICRIQSSFHRLVRQEQAARRRSHGVRRQSPQVYSSSSQVYSYARVSLTRHAADTPMAVRMRACTLGE